MKIRGIALRLALLAALSLGAACDRTPTDDDSAPPMVAAPVAVATDAQASPVMASEVETTMARSGVQPGTGMADHKAIAGTFTGALPCADCPGIDARLVLSADGTFELNNVYRERPGSDAVTRGTWAMEPDGRSLRLDPGSKSETDRLFGLEDDDTLVPLDDAGQPVESPFDLRLRRGS